MAKLKIKQVKSGIHRPAGQKQTLLALGLKMNKSREVEVTPQIAGMINKVKHLLVIEEA